MQQQFQTILQIYQLPLSFPLSRFIWMNKIEFPKQVIAHNSYTMKIKSSHSFFPTKIAIESKTPTQSHTKTYKLIKKKPIHSESSSFRNPSEISQQNQLSSSNKINKRYGATTNTKQEVKRNIFKDDQMANCKLEFNVQLEKPVGGIEMFKKQQVRKNKEDSRRRGGSREYVSKEIIENNSNINSFKRSSPNHDEYKVYSSPPFVFSHSEPQTIDYDQEVYKHHEIYDSCSHTKSNKWKSRPSTSGTYKSNIYSKNINSSGGNSRSLANYNKKFQDTSKHSKWVTQQNKAYQAKMGIRNQLFFNKPLIQRYGDRYFQYILRNRYEQDFQPPQYLHQIQQPEQQQSLKKDRFISKLRKLKPNIRNYDKLTLKGHHIREQYDDEYLE